eukprot:165472-Amphidinium_carterae.1
MTHKRLKKGWGKLVPGANTGSRADILAKLLTLGQHFGISPTIVSDGGRRLTSSVQYYDHLLLYTENQNGLSDANMDVVIYDNGSLPSGCERFAHGHHTEHLSSGENN